MFKLIIVGFLWGVSNPSIKRGAIGVEKIKKSSLIYQYISEVFYLWSRWQYVLPFVINQIGSVAYYFSLHNYALSLAVPMVNSSTFLFTAVTGWAIGEDAPHSRTLLGMVLILAGITCYVLDKL